VTLRRKTLVIIGATLLGLLITFFVLTRVTLLRRLREYEAQQTRREVQRASTALETEISQLDTIVRDDAVWDEAYEFVQHPNRKFLESNFPRAIFSDLRIDLVIFLNSSDEVIFERLADHPLDPTLQQALDKKLLQPGVLVRPASAEAIVSGIINLPDGPTMVSASQILRSSGEGPSRGTLIMGRRLNANEIHRLSLLTRLDLQVYPFDDPRLPADFQAIQGSLSRLNPIATRPLSKQYVAGYQQISGVDGQPALMMRIRLPRDLPDGLGGDCGTGVQCGYGVSARGTSIVPVDQTWEKRCCYWYARRSFGTGGDRRRRRVVSIGASDQPDVGGLGESRARTPPR